MFCVHIQCPDEGTFELPHLPLIEPYIQAHIKALSDTLPHSTSSFPHAAVTLETQQTKALDFPIVVYAVPSSKDRMTATHNIEAQQQYSQRVASPSFTAHSIE